MKRTVEAIFDGEVLRPQESLDLEPNMRVRLTFEVPTARTGRRSFLQTARSLELSGPPDLSEKIEDYLYGE